MVDRLVSFDLDALGTPDNNTRNVTENGNNAKPKQGTKRKKYAAKACQDCKRRKVRCSGEAASCQQCWSRNVRCRYSPGSPSPGDRDEQAEDDTRHNIPSRTESTQSVAPQAPGPEALSSSALLSATVSDPRFDGLCDRVGALERMLTHLLKSAKATESLSPSATLQTPIRLTTMTEDDDDDEDQFAVRPTPHDDLTLSSQVAAMSALLSKPSSPKPSGGGKQTAKVAAVLVEFPDPPTLQHLLDVYFRDMDNYFPFLDRDDTESRIQGVIRRLGYSSYNLMLVVTAEDLSIIALACIMMALAECVDPGEGACDGDTKSGWERYLQSCRLLQRFTGSSKTLDLDAVRAQCLVAAYLMHCETLSAASEAVFATWRLTTSIRLNNQRAWPIEDAKKTLSRQKLWWTIYFLDRQISRRSGSAYHIRDTEFDVDDFTLTENLSVGNSKLQDDWHSSITRSYIQALINLARLWGNIWDTCFAVGAKKKGDWMEIEIMDARILNTRRQLPKTLTWDSNELDTYILAGEDGPHIRRRLLIFTRLELLRMLIRQNPVRQTEFNPETAHLCARISREVIRAHDLYISKYPGARAIGYISTSTTVECIYHLASVMHYSKDTNERSASVSAFNQAHGVLLKLSAYSNVAKKALKALNGVVRKWGSSNATGDPGSTYAGTSQDDFGELNVMNAISPQFHNPQGNTLQLGSDGFNVDLSEWMKASMGSIYGRDFDFQMDTRL